MKKVTILIFALLCYVLTAPAAQAFTPTGEAMVTPFVTTTEMDTRMDTAVKKTTKAVNGHTNRQIRGVRHEIANVNSAVTSLAGTSRENTWILGGLGLLSLLIIVGAMTFIHRRGQRQVNTENAAVFTAIGQVVTAVEQARDRVISEVPAATDRLVKTLSPFEPFVLDGKTITFTPKIVNGSYQSLYVNEEGVMVRYDKPGKLHSSMSSLLKKWLDPEKRKKMDPKQVAIIEITLDEGSLRIA